MVNDVLQRYSGKTTHLECGRIADREGEFSDPYGHCAPGAGNSTQKTEGGWQKLSMEPVRVWARGRKPAFRMVLREAMFSVSQRAGW